MVPLQPTGACVRRLRSFYVFRVREAVAAAQKKADEAAAAAEAEKAAEKNSKKVKKVFLLPFL